MVGVDCEPILSQKDAESIYSCYFIDLEKVATNQVKHIIPIAVTIALCAKEAVYKALSNTLGVGFIFMDTKI